MCTVSASLAATPQVCHEFKGHHQVWCLKWGVLQLGRRQASGCCWGPLHRLCAAHFKQFLVIKCN